MYLQQGCQDTRVADTIFTEPPASWGIQKSIANMFISLDRGQWRGVSGQRMSKMVLQGNVYHLYGKGKSETASKYMPRIGIFADEPTSRKCEQ